MKITNIAAAQQLVTAARTVAERFEAPSCKVQLATGALSDGHCMCALGHLFVEFGIDKTELLDENKPNWVEIIGRKLNVTLRTPQNETSDDYLRIADLTEVVWKANDRSKGDLKAAAKGLRVFADGLEDEIKESE